MTNTTTATAKTIIHPFEARGLGQAPFRFVGMVEQDLCYGEAILNREEYQRTGIALTTKPGGSCAYCGTYIVNMYRVRSADGREFHVGCECVEKVAKAAAGTAHERETAALLAPIRRAKNARAKALRTARGAAKAAELAATAEQRHGELLARLDRADHPAFQRMAEDLRNGRVANLSPRQIAWLEQTEAR